MGFYAGQSYLSIEFTPVKMLVLELGVLVFS